LFKFITSLIFTLFVSLNVLAQTPWVEGTHYKVMAESASNQAQVKEVFSFWCPHCYKFESIATQVKQSLPDDVSFKKVHVNFLGSASTEAQNDATKALLAARAMDDEVRFNRALFDAIHKDRKAISGMDDILAVYSTAGGDSGKMQKLSESFGIKGQITKNDNEAKGVRTVPTFIVNEKYQAIFTREMTPDQFVELIVWLSSQK
jgi:protein dithiol oxidoreductase (disulfide-forming)